ncbi:MAG: peptide deformylase [Burkholderiales bacterium]|nr:peptide deformylase [Burkholderiales bacterium]
MALLTILEYPDPRLKRIAAPVTEFTPAIKKLVDDMAHTMYEAPGIGLAATQVDVHKRIVVIDVSEDKSDLRVFINPEIIEADGELVGEEGCLSVPGYYDNVKRAGRVKVRAQDATGAAFELEATELLAVCIQHEMDHLKGTVFVDHLSQLKQVRVKNKMKKRHREAERG